MFQNLDYEHFNTFFQKLERWTLDVGCWALTQIHKFEYEYEHRFTEYEYDPRKLPPRFFVAQPRGGLAYNLTFFGKAVSSSNALVKRVLVRVSESFKCEGLSVR